MDLGKVSLLLFFFFKEKTYLYLHNSKSSPLYCTKRVRQGGDTNQRDAGEEVVPPYRTENTERERPI